MTTFNDLFTKFVGGAFARQFVLADLVGDRGWDLDLSTGVVTFGDDIQLPIQLVGTESTGNASWMWAWANPDRERFADYVVASQRLCEFGQAHGIELLTAPRFGLGEVSPHALAMVAGGLLGGVPYYRGPYDGGAIYFLVPLPESIAVAPLPIERISTVLAEVISQFELDHQLMTASFLREQGFEITQQGSAWEAKAPDGRSVRVEFNDRGLLAGISGTLRGA